MAKSSSLSSDIDFIKEFEELRLKQRILIETLNRQKASKEKELIHEINTKLDFLVKIFKDTAENANDFNEKEYLDLHFEALNKQVDGMREHFEQTLDELSTKVESLSEIKKLLEEKKSNDSKKESSVSTSPVVKDGSLPSSELQTKNSTSQTSSSSDSTPSQEKAEAPMPDFKVNSSSVSGSEKSVDKKKGWF